MPAPSACPITVSNPPSKSLLSMDIMECTHKIFPIFFFRNPPPPIPHKSVADVCDLLSI